MSLNPRDNAVHYPATATDRRFYLWLRRPWNVGSVLLVLILLPIVVAWIQYLAFGLPPIAGELPAEAAAEQRPFGFPPWLRMAHYVNLFFIVLLMRSGLSILMDHPRLYWNDHCTLGTEWIRFTPVTISPNQIWTAKEDARYLSPWLGLPGYRHTIGMARHWHLLSALFWFVNGLIYAALLLGTGQWQRLVPESTSIIPEAWSTFVHYATFHMPPEMESLNRYNALQQLSYFGVVLIMAPLSFLTGMAMSPSIVNRFPWYAKLFGGRQSARSIHFLLLMSYIGFLVIHVAMVIASGFAKNMNWIVFGGDDGSLRGAVVGLVGIGLVGVACLLAHKAAWKFPRVLQYLARAIHTGLMRRLIFRHIDPRARYTGQDISPKFWPNGKMPDSEEWTALAANDFADYRLEVHGLVEKPVQLSLDEIAALGKQEQITMHHCIQGWTGIAKWGGLPLSKLVEHVQVKPEANVVVFHSFGEGLYGGEYYDTQKLENVLHPQCIIATEMNGEALGRLYGAPLRLRVENQLGYKMVKWIKSIEFVASERDVGLGFGGKNEDDEYFDLIPEI